MHKPTYSTSAIKSIGNSMARRALVVGLSLSLAGCASTPLMPKMPARKIAAQQTALQSPAMPRTSHEARQAEVRTVSHQEYSSQACLESGQSLSDRTCVTAQCAADACTCHPMLSGMPAMTQYWNDQEYIYDGGDREPKVQVSEDWQVRGLDSQDTIAHYETIDGQLCVAASNRVPIYAPRFGAVRKMTAPTIAARAVGATPLVDPVGPAVQAIQEPAGAVTSPVGPRHRDATKLIDGLHARTRGVAAEKLLPAIDLSGYQLALHRLQNHTTSHRREDLLALIGEYMVNARTWESHEGVGVAINGVAAAQTRDAKTVQDVTLFETEPGKCSLRIFKAASHSAANPGDIVHFSIRFDNVGSKPIGNLVIMDSLVTRLEYIDGSQQCLLSLASNKSSDNTSVKFSTAENEAGSTVLRWEADLPLEVGDSGVITFQCRVR